MDLVQISVSPEVETVDAVNYFGMDMGKLAVSRRACLPVEPAAPARGRDAERRVLLSDPLSCSARVQFYQVVIKSETHGTWTVRRRYQMFCDLHAQLERFFNNLPELPPKLYDIGSFALARWFLPGEKVNAQYTPEFLGRRRKDLSVYMKKLHSVPCISTFPVFLNFIEAIDKEELKTWSGGLKPVIKGTRGNLSEASQVLAKSHMENGVWKHIFPDLEEKELFESLSAVFEILTLSCFEYGYALCQRESVQLEAVALVVPPNCTVTQADLLVAGLPKAAAQIGGWATNTLREVGEKMAMHHTSIMGTTPHWFLWYIASDPNYTGRGSAGKLMKRFLAMVDETELPCYTECTDAKALPFLKKFGFNVEEYHENPTLTYMLRPAKKRPSGAAAVAPPGPAPGGHLASTLAPPAAAGGAKTAAPAAVPEDPRGEAPTAGPGGGDDAAPAGGFTTI